MVFAKRGKVASTAIAFVGMLHAQAVSAQDCIDPQDLTDAGIYAVPVIVEGFRASCAANLSPDGFFATQGEAFVGPYKAMQAERWPGAMRVVMTFATRGDDAGEDAETRALLENLPPEALRPFVDAILAQKLGEAIKTEDCGKVERAMELLAPLPPENFGGLLTFVMEMAGAKDPSICEVESP